MDFSGASRRALENAVQLARTFLAELVVLTVIESLSYYYPYMQIPDEECQKNYEAKQREEFDQLPPPYRLFTGKLLEKADSSGQTAPSKYCCLLEKQNPTFWSWDLWAEPACPAS